jgi:hypothetical protein
MRWREEGDEIERGREMEMRWRECAPNMEMPRAHTSTPPLMLSFLIKISGER